MSQTDGPALEIRGVSKAFGGVPALQDLSFSVAVGTVAGLLGRNGAGKTTTLRILLGLVRADAGSVSILGNVVRPGVPVLHQVGALVEGPGFVPYLTGRLNLELYWRAGARRAGAQDRQARQARGREREAVVASAVELADLGDAIDRPVRTYSRGMRQRLAIAQAALGDPPILVLDEPADGLDPHQIVALRSALRRLAELGTTILLSSHLLAEVEQVCTHAVVIEQGRLVRDGPIADVTTAQTASRIEVDDDSRARSVLEQLPGITVSVGPGDVLLVQHPHVERADLVDALVSARVRVSAVLPGGSLESVFLALTEEAST